MIITEVPQESRAFVAGVALQERFQGESGSSMWTVEAASLLRHGESGSSMWTVEAASLLRHGESGSSMCESSRFHGESGSSI